MGVQPPYIYDPVRTEGPKSPYKEFDPKAVTRASFQTTRSRPKSEGPLISFNQHPDSYFIFPYGNTNANPMDLSVKNWIKWMRIIQLVLRCLETLAAAGQLAMMILLKPTDASTGWIMRIAPGVAMLNTVYAIYHLARKPSGRTPGSSFSYMLFASFFDVSILPFYAFAALVAKTHGTSWGTISSNSSLVPTFSTILFYLAVVGGGLHVISLAISLYLAVTFRKITQLPPDMNPLEDNLTSRHKRNKSSMSTATTIVSEREKRLSAPLESKHSSGAAYEDLSRPPTIPFFHTRTQSTTSFSTYRSTPPPSRDDHPSRQYQIRPDSSRSTPPKKNRPSSYADLPTSDSASQRSSHPLSKMREAWFTTDSRTSPRKGTQYEPLHQLYDASASDLGDHPNPLFTNPPIPQHNFVPTGRDQALADLLDASNKNSRGHSGDIGEMSTRDLIQRREGSHSPAPERESSFKAKAYGELKPGTPPLMIGGKNDRQVSSGNDYTTALNSGSFKVPPREVSGKIAEEGRANNNGWGTRLRKISGMKQ